MKHLINYYIALALMIITSATAWADPTSGTVNFVAKSRSTISGTTFTTDKNAGNAYALAIADLSKVSGISNAGAVIIEYDVQINSGDRLLTGVGDMAVRGETANGSSKATYNTDGIIMRYGAADNSSMRVNGGTSNSVAFGLNSHVKLTLNRVSKTYEYVITKKETGTVLFQSEAPITTEEDNATVVELYSWNNNQSNTISPVTYTIIPKATVAFDASTVFKNVGDDAFTKTVSTNTGDGTVTYSSGNTEVATVDASTGEVTLGARGTAIITATPANTDNFIYDPATVSYTLEVISKQPLTDAIDAATTYYNSINGKAVYNEVASTLNDAIQAAQAVLDQTEVTNEAIDEAAATLSTAVTQAQTDAALVEIDTKTYALSCETGGLGSAVFTVATTETTTASYGDQVKLTITPSEGYAVSSVTGVWSSTFEAAQSRSNARSDADLIKEFEVTGSDNVYTFTMKAAAAKLTVNFKKSLAHTDITVSTINAQEYTGSAIEPTFTVTDGETTLEEGTDYTITYANNTNVSTTAPATITLTAVEGNANYAGTREITFTITPKPLTTDMVGDIDDQKYTGAAIEPAVTVTINGTALTASTDYTVDSYSSNTAVGTATINISGRGYYSGTINKTFSIVARNVNNVTFELSAYDFEYDGTAHEPAVTGKNGSIALTEGTDFTVVYSDNTEVGTGKATVTGQGNYTGTRELQFSIYEPTSEVEISTPTGGDSHGTVSVSPSWASDGEEVTVEVTPEQGYEVDQILVNGQPIEGNTFTYYSGDVVSVTYRPIQEPAPVIEEERNIKDAEGNTYNVTVQNITAGSEGETVNEVVVNELPESVLNGTAEIPATITFAGNEYEITKVEASAFEGKADNVVIFLPDAASTTAPVTNVVNGDGTVGTLNLTEVANFEAKKTIHVEQVNYAVTLPNASVNFFPICLPYAAPIPNGWRGGRIKLCDGATFTFGNAPNNGHIDANTPYVMERLAEASSRRSALMAGSEDNVIDFSAENVVIEKTEEIQPEVAGDFKLVGTEKAITHGEGYAMRAYKLQPNGKWEMTASSSYFSRNEEYIPAFSAYLIQSVYTGGSIGIVNDGTTGIRSITQDDSDNDSLYDLQGRRATTPVQKGIFIKNGKKVVMK